MTTQTNTEKINLFLEDEAKFYTRVLQATNVEGFTDGETATLTMETEFNHITVRFTNFVYSKAWGFINYHSKEVTKEAK